MIKTDEENGLFTLYTKHTAMILKVCYGFVGMVYYGEKIKFADTEDFENAYPDEPTSGDAVQFYNTFPHIYPFYGCGDFRETAFRAELENGADTCCLKYIGCSISKEKPKLPGLPHSFSRNGDTETLILYLHDEKAGVLAEVMYTLFQDSDVIVQNIRVQNQGEAPVMLRKVLSSCIYVDGNLDTLTLNGTKSREHQPQRMPLGYGVQSISSRGGCSSHEHNPVFALLRPDTTETNGEIWGMVFVYSGNFLALAEKDAYGKTRLMMGIQPETFCWELQPGKTFCTPEVLLNYTCHGIGKFSRTYHNFIRRHIIRSKWQNQERPVLVNTWEATYYDYDAEKILQFADATVSCNLDMLVLDDGWFGHRDNEESSLGDWVADEEKIPEGLPWLSHEIHERSLKFGLWIEPEMVSPDSDLYRRHPEWIVRIPDRTPTLSRSQYVLDMIRPEVRNYLFEKLEKLIRESEIDYLKWDMNRPITEAYSPALPAHRQKEFFHRYILGVYELQERILKAFPTLLLENCAGGGGRFDCGMLYFSPQIWCSDNTDACDRAKIQLGISLCYPPSCMAAHVSVCPNHTVARNTQFLTRANVALFGAFGYEMDLSRLSETEIRHVQEQVQTYHQYGNLVRKGNLYRLEQSGEFIAWQFVSPDRTESLVTVLQVRNLANQGTKFLKLQGLIPEICYQIKEVTYTGQQLMKIGFPLEFMWGDGVSQLLYLKVKPIEK